MKQFACDIDDRMRARELPTRGEQRSDRETAKRSDHRGNEPAAPEARCAEIADRDEHHRDGQRDIGERLKPRHVGKPMCSVRRHRQCLHPRHGYNYREQAAHVAKRRNQAQEEDEPLERE